MLLGIAIGIVIGFLLAVAGMVWDAKMGDPK